MQVFLCIKGYVVSFYHNICIVAAQCFIWLYKMDKMKWKTERKTEQKLKNPTKRDEKNNEKRNQQPDRQERKQKQKIIVLHTSYI